MQTSPQPTKFNAVPAEWLPILECLRQDARMSLTRMSTITGMPITTLAGRIKMLEERKVIKQYTTQIDFATIGYPIHIHANIKPKDGSVQKLTTMLQDHIAINRLTSSETPSGEEWLLGEFLFPSITELNAFTRMLKQTEHCASFDMHYMQELIRHEHLGIEQQLAPQTWGKL